MIKIYLRPFFRMSVSSKNLFTFFLFYVFFLVQKLTFLIKKLQKISNTQAFRKFNNNVWSLHNKDYRATLQSEYKGFLLLKSFSHPSVFFIFPCSKKLYLLIIKKFHIQLSIKKIKWPLLSAAYRFHIFIKKKLIEIIFI